MQLVICNTTYSAERLLLILSVTLVTTEIKIFRSMWAQLCSKLANQQRFTRIAAFQR